ncbi:hypothetical protein GQ600_15923 [Phytophthora cactorum]|nr:hypothetical protein GQ600_15923 [Phytophthora cactorum]
MKRARDFSGFPAPKRHKTDYNELLNAIFRFKHKTPSDCQDEALCNVLVKQLAGLVATLKPVTVASYCCALVNPLSTIAPFRSPSSQIMKLMCCWGLVVVWNLQVMISTTEDMFGMIRGYRSNQDKRSGVKLEVIFVDGWERMLHFLPTGNCVHSAVPKTFNTLHCADLDAALEEKFEGCSMRSCGKLNWIKGQSGFIAAVVRRAVAVVTSIVEEDEDVSSDKDSLPMEERPMWGNTREEDLVTRAGTCAGNDRTQSLLRSKAFPKNDGEVQDEFASIGGK